MKPVVIFTFNRVGNLELLISSLLVNADASETDLFIHVDGPRTVNDIYDVQSVRNYVLSIKGFKSVNYIFQDKNKGLANSIIDYLDLLFVEFESLIVLEDDLLVSGNFLSYMNVMLTEYNRCDKIFSICAYSNKISRPTNYTYDIYYGPRSSSWGWGTWRDRWLSVDWSVTNIEKQINSLDFKNKFNAWGGSDMYDLLMACKQGRNSSWAIRFCLSQYLQDKISVFPCKSKILNNGFSASGTHCKGYSRFTPEFDREGLNSFSLPLTVAPLSQIVNSTLKYHSVLFRIKSKIMNIIRF